MIKIDKRYKIKFGYAGIAQYAEFSESEGVIYNPSLYISYTKANETPDVSECKTIDEILAKIKTIAYGGKAEIDTINGHPVFYYKKDKTRNLIKGMDAAFECFVETQAKIFYVKELRPLLIKNKWKISSSHVGMPILVELDKNGEWDNVRNKKKEFEFEYLCEVFLNTMNIESRFVVCGFFNLITDYSEFYLEL